MRIRSGVVDQYIYFVAVDATDFVSRETGLASFTVVRSRNGAANVTYTTPTVTEIDLTTMPGVYALLLDEDMSLDAGDYTQEVALHITHAGMAPVTRTFELFTDAEGDVSDVLSRLVVTNSQLLVVKSDTSDIRSALVIIASDAAAIDSNVDKVYSDTTIIYSDTTTIQSDVTTLASDLAEGDFSDILSRLTVTNSNVLIIKSDVSDVLSRAVVINSETTDIQSETEVIQSQVVAIRAIVSDIQSDTNVMVPIVSDIQSDTNVLITKMRGVVLATGTIGATGNTTTVIHIPDGVLDSLSDDEINGYGVVIYDVSLDEYHVRTIIDWTNVGDLATVSTLPFTPEASVDLYWILPPYSQQFEYDNSDIVSLLTLVRSDTAVIEAVSSDIQSDTNKLVSDATEVDTSDIMSRLALIHSETTDIQSETEVIQSLAVLIEAYVSDTYSDTTAIHTQTTAIASDTTTLASDLAEADFSDIHSRLTVVLSDTSDIRSHLTAITGAAGVISDIASGVDAIQAAGGALTVAQDSKLTQVHSDVISQFVVLEQNTSDTESALVKVYSDTTAIEAAGGSLSVAQDSKLTKINSGAIIIKSDVAQLTFTVAGKVDANIEYVNGTEVTGAGSEADPWGP
jgi:hypothetical protein